MPTAVEFPNRKAGTGMSVVFPDVCDLRSVAGPPPTPLPYPNFAKTALLSQKKMPGSGVVPQPQTPTGSKTPVTSKVVPTNTKGATTFGAPTVLTEKGMMGITGSPARHNEAVQLRGALGQLNSRLQGMTSKDPNEWQKVLQDYAVAASALYVTLNTDDDD